MNNFYNKLDSLNFIVKNVSRQRKSIAIFGLSIPFGRSADLLAIPSISEDDIRTSLAKGELAEKIKRGDIKLVASTINLSQIDPAQAEFINNASDDTANFATFPGNTVVWAPYKDASPAHVTTWAEAVAAVQSMKAPETFIFIDANPDEDSVEIPGGEWNLNNTMIVGPKPQNPSSDTDYRSYEEKLYLHTESNGDNHCRLNGVRGLKDLYFRGEEFEASAATVGSATEPNYGDTAVLTLGYLVDGRMRVGDIVEVDGSGYYRVVSVDLANSAIAILNEGYGSTGGTISDNTIVWVDTSVFYVNDVYGTDNKFILDNVDFRFGNYRWGTFHVDYDGEVSFKLINGASVRWYAVKVDNYATFESDGSACWIGYDAVFGDGFVDIYSLPGMEFHDGQDISYSAHQGITFYQPDNYSNWSGSYPETVHEALDRLAAACVAAGHTP